MPTSGGGGARMERRVLDGAAADDDGDSSSGLTGHFRAGSERELGIGFSLFSLGKQKQHPCENMPPKFKRHLNDDDVTGSVKSERRNLLEEDSDEEEDFFLRGPSGPRFGPKNDKIRHVQNQVDEVIDVMQENITKVIERGERLDDLQDKSESLSDNATAFSNRSKQLRRQMWWRGCKMKAIVALVAVAVLLVIIVPIILKYNT
ncbi:UNVERIFIED_CONTAM: Vesicle-associated membrane protein 4 [Gekko kuhli]